MRQHRVRCEILGNHRIRYLADRYVLYRGSCRGRAAGWWLRIVRVQVDLYNMRRLGLAIILRSGAVV